MTPLLIIFPQTLLATAFCLQHLENVAGWLWHNPQADQSKHVYRFSRGFFLYPLLSVGYSVCCSATTPSPYLKAKNKGFSNVKYTKQAKAKHGATLNLPKKTAPDEVKGSKEFITYYNALKRDSEEYKRISECIVSLKKDCGIGDKVGKEKIPPHYVKKYGITNLYRAAIGNSRLTYTIIADKDKKVLCILEYFPTHKEYSERFGYDT